MPSKHKSSAVIIPLDEAVDHVLAHDITEIRPGQFKGAAFKKGHILKEQDLEHLRRLGKEHLFVLHIGPHELHEDEAALRLAKALSGPGVLFKGQPSEGKLSLLSASRGPQSHHPLRYGVSLVCAAGGCDSPSGYHN